MSRLDDMFHRRCTVRGNKEVYVAGIVAIYSAGRIRSMHNASRVLTPLVPFISKSTIDMLQKGAMNLKKEGRWQVESVIFHELIGRQASADRVQRDLMHGDFNRGFVP